MSRFLSAALLSTLTLANSVPIYGSYPGWITGSGAAGINVELVIDLLCADCMRGNSVWNEVLSTSFLDGVVSDHVFWAYSPFPLSYHVHAFQVAQMVPYFQALCIEQG